MYKYSNIIYKEKTLSCYCMENEIPYHLIRSKIYYDKKHGYIEDLPNKERIDLYIEKYYKSAKIKQIRQMLNSLQKENFSSLEYKLIAKKLNINYPKILTLRRSSKFSTSIGQFMILTWYCSDVEGDKGMYISKNKLKNLETKNNLDVNDLIGLFKSINNEYLIDIIEFEKKLY
ncbi:MAG: hypothetical protein IJ068_07660 [Bacilli bacterium]|nr:hypothetical protein [Bacilli bacterium]